uniref:Uncharacterized protein n=1 Tax=Micrurus carvalhoi TaxID=3147026 RepID=A0A2H6N8F4_9SAUR
MALPTSFGAIRDNSTQISQPLFIMNGLAFYSRQRCWLRIPMILEPPVLRKLFYTTNDGFLGTCTWKNTHKNANYKERKQHCAGMRQEQNQAKSIEKQYSREFWSEKITFGLRQHHE